MSNAIYDELWRNAQDLLEETVQLDSTVQQTKVPRERDEARGQLAELYVRYIDLGNKFEECYDQIVQPQKRPLLKRLLDSVIGRVLEIKHELVEVDLSEYNYCDDALLSRKLTPDDVEMRVPRYFRREREIEIESRRRFIEETLTKLGELEEKQECKKMTELEAIRLIQAHERARQGRVRFQFMKEILEMKERSTIRSESRAPDAATGVAAALKIQKVWRGYATRRRIRQRKLDEMLLIGDLHIETSPGDLNLYFEPN